MKITGEGIQFLRFVHQLSKAGFARKVGISRPLVAMIESNEREVSGRTQRKIMDAFNLDLEKVAELERKAKHIKKGAV